MRPDVSKAWVAAVTAVVFVAAGRAPAAPEVGRPAPPLTLSLLEQAPDDASAAWEDLRGKVVVLEFWATWCGPCVAAMPHLDALREAFADRDVVVLAVTDETPDVVRPFLGRRPFGGWIGYDEQGATGRAYDVRAIPRTFVVGKDGVLLADTHPTALTAGHLEAALRGNPVDLPEVDEAPRVAVDPDPAAPAAVVEAWVRPAPPDPAAAFTRISWGFEEVEISNVTAGQLIEHTHSGRMRPDLPLIVDADLPEGRFDLRVRVPRERAREVDDLVWQTVAFTFGVRRETETREVDVYVLRRVEGQEDKLPRVEAREPIVATRLEGDSVRLDISAANGEELVESFGPIFDRLVVSGLDPDDYFDLDVKLPMPPTRQCVVDALAGVGLQFVEETREMRVYVVTGRGSD